MNKKETPLIVIVGPTASGKTSLAVEVAEKFNGEIICADSRTVYRHLAIGTAKPDSLDRCRVVHWGLDLIDPDENFSVAGFKRYAQEAIDDIRARQKVPFLVGGSGLYINSVIYNYQFDLTDDAKKNSCFEKMTIKELHEYCFINNIELPENNLNKRYVIRNIERNGRCSRVDNVLTKNTFVVGISTTKSILRDRIKLRIDQMIDNGVVKEATEVGDFYGWNCEAMKGNAYPLIKKYLDGEFNVDILKSKLSTADWKLAKRQMTWFKRDANIKWGELDDIKEYLYDLFAN